jgi:hypothetical protein
MDADSIRKSAWLSALSVLLKVAKTSVDQELARFQTVTVAWASLGT